MTEKEDVREMNFGRNLMVDLDRAWDNVHNSSDEEAKEEHADAIALEKMMPSGTIIGSQ